MNAYDLIHQSDNQTYRNFEETVKEMEPDELQAAADRAGVNVAPGSDWRDYQAAFEQLDWNHFQDAYKHGTGYEYGQK